MDRLHKRLRQIAHYEGPLDDTGILLPSQPDPSQPVDNGPNLHSFEPFKHRKFKCKSTGKGPIGPTNLEAMVSCNEYQYNTRPTWHQPKRNNLTPSERRALKELQSNEKIVIKPADKGSGVVIMDRIDYLREGYTQLSDIRFYTKLPSCPTEQY